MGTHMMKKEHLMKLSAFLAAVLNNQFNRCDIYYSSELEKIFFDCKDKYGWYREAGIYYRLAMYNVFFEFLDREVSEMPEFDSSTQEILEFSEKMQHLKEDKEHVAYMLDDCPYYVWVIEDWHYLVRKLLHSYLYEFKKLMEDKWTDTEYLSAVELYDALKDTLKGWDDFIIENQVQYASLTVN